jgi:hypothetical protein
MQKNVYIKDYFLGGKQKREAKWRNLSNFKALKWEILRVRGRWIRAKPVWWYAKEVKRPQIRIPIHSQVIRA